MKRTPLYDEHVKLAGRLVEFGGWQMPLYYPAGVLTEHLLTRAGAGLFDICHMGRFHLRGPGALPLLQRAASNDAAALEVGRAHYTLLPTPTGGAVDDAFLYRFEEEGYLLVVNAANREKDLEHLREQGKGLGGWECLDQTAELAMLALQGPHSEEILKRLLQESGAAGALPAPRRNALAAVQLRGGSLAGGPRRGTRLRVARTGYTGEPLGFELIVPREAAVALWRALLALGADPVGLGARDSLRLEAGLPLYGHELGMAAAGPDPAGPVGEIPVFAIPQARFAVRPDAPGKEDLVGREALLRQAEAHRRLRAGDPAGHAGLPYRVRRVALLGRGIGRAGDPLLAEGRPAGRLSSGTAVPYWSSAQAQAAEWEGRQARLTREAVPAAIRPGEAGRRAIGLALLDSRLPDGQPLEAEVRGGRSAARVVPGFLEAGTRRPAGAGPYTRPRLYEGG